MMIGVHSLSIVEVLTISHFNYAQFENTCTYTITELLTHTHYVLLPFDTKCKMFFLPINKQTQQHFFFFEFLHTLKNKTQIKYTS